MNLVDYDAGEPSSSLCHIISFLPIMTSSTIHSSLILVNLILVLDWAEMQGHSKTAQQSKLLALP